MRKPNTAKGAETQDLRQRAARARDAAGRFIKRPEPAEPDPVHALIEEHRAAYAEWDRLSAAWNDMEVGAPGYREAVAASKGPAQQEIAAYEALFSAQPTTLAGAAALGAYLSEAIRKTSTYAQPTDGERALSAITVAVQRLDQPSTDPHPDAALLVLGAAFMAAWAAEDATGTEAAYRACGRIAERIVQTPAVTVEGYGIKALLLARLDSDESGPHRPIAAQGPPASHWNVLRQVQQGAARRVGMADMGISMSVAMGPETGFPAAGSDAGDRLPSPQHDLSALSIAQLARLHSAIVHAEEAIGSAENRPCFTDRSRFVFTPAGLIIKREADRLSQFSCAIAQEAGRRVPVDESEREERLSTLISHATLAGGLGEHPELIAEINATWGV